MLQHQPALTINERMRFAVAITPLPSQEVLRQLLDYDPETGKLFWKARAATTSRISAWNTQNAGNEAFTATNGGGYRVGRIYGQNYRAHRVIWEMEFGSVPDLIDHIDGDTANNRLGNLREASYVENGRNVKRPSHNTSGVVGVSWSARDSAWYAYASIHRRKLHLGLFATKQQAIDARQSFNDKVGFTARHGT